MKIAILTTENQHNELLELLKKKWPSYNFDSESYAKTFDSNDLEKNLYEELAFRRNEILNNNKNENQFYLTSPLKTLAEILSESEAGNITDHEFIADSILLNRNAIKLYDVIFWVNDPNNKLNTIYNSVNHDYWNRTGVIFPEKDMPAFIELSAGKPNQIVNQIAEFIDQNGNAYDPNDNFWNEELEALKKLK